MTVAVNLVPERPKVQEKQDSVTRPSDTTQYAAGDALSDNATTATSAGYFAITFDIIPQGGMTLIDFTLHKSDQDTTGADFDLLLFTTAPAFAGFEDNAASAITDAEMQDCKGVVRFASTASGSSPGWTNVGTGNAQTVSQPIGIVFAAGSSTVYGIIVLAGTYTPASAEVFTLTVKGIQD